MKSWNQLFVRHGWLVKEIESNVFDCSNETQLNLEYLIYNLQKLELEFHFDGRILRMVSRSIPEEMWAEQLDFSYRGHGGWLWFEPGVEQPKIQELDFYIAGIVRQFNRLGFFTNMSCDGHGKRHPNVGVIREGDKGQQLRLLLDSLGYRDVRCIENKKYIKVIFPMDRNLLFDITEQLSIVDASILEEGGALEEQLFYAELEQLLSIEGVSGNERTIRNVVQKKLSPYVEFITVDNYGNLLAERTYGSGAGPTILLNAHLDVARELVSSRRIIKDNGIWSSDKGILGADDRAGISVLLNVARYLHHNRVFNGRIKFVFTVEEEVGLVGASNVADYFLWGVDAAVVVDRRNTGDIVTSCGGYIPFCDEAYGRFIEQTAINAGLMGWKCTAGGSSDTRIWAEHGIQSVNLSVGYNDEHTNAERLDIEACYGTAKLIRALLGDWRTLCSVLREIRRKQNV